MCTLGLSGCGASHDSPRTPEKGLNTPFNFVRPSWGRRVCEGGLRRTFAETEGVFEGSFEGGQRERPVGGCRQSLHCVSVSILVYFSSSASHVGVHNAHPETLNTDSTLHAPA